MTFFEFNVSVFGCIASFGVKEFLLVLINGGANAGECLPVIVVLVIFSLLLFFKWCCAQYGAALVGGNDSDPAIELSAHSQRRRRVESAKYRGYPRKTIR